MRPHLLLLTALALAACASRRPAAAAVQLPAPLAAPQPLSPEQLLLQAEHVGVYRIVRMDEECSGMGGTHLTLLLEQAGWGEPPERGGAGGHAARFHYPVDVAGPLEAPPPGSVRTPVYAVAAVTPTRRIGRDHPGWCLVNLPEVRGWVGEPGAALDLVGQLPWELLDDRAGALERLAELERARAGQGPR